MLVGWLLVGCAGPAREPAAGGAATTPVSTDPGDPCVAPPLDAPVVSLVEGTTESFQDFAAWWTVPEEPRALVWFFHGSKGTYEQIDGVEVRYLMNLLTPQGYAAVATNSSDRESAEWDKSSTDPALNTELARLLALRDHLVATTALADDTPIVLAGFSDGGSTAAWFSSIALDQGWDVRVVSIHNSPAADYPSDGIEAPTFWAVSEHDNSTVKGGAERFAKAQEADLGWPSRYLVAPEVVLTPTRFARSPEVGENLSLGFFDEAVRLGLVAADGTRAVTDDLSQGAAMDEIARYFEANVDSVEAWRASAQLRVTWATHRYNGYHAEEECRFYGRFIE
ncbi:MAG: hypothetical protein ACI8PZ_002817 [Myxococcota bacterium]|jgi:hypothetical protein